MPVRGLCWLLCCRGGFRLLGRDDGEAEASEELVEVSSDRSMGDPERQDSPEPAEEMRRLIGQGAKRDSVTESGDVVLQGWLFLQLPTSRKLPWPRSRRQWLVLTRDSLDVYSGDAPGARRLGSMVLTSLCSVRGADSVRFARTGYWNVSVYGRKNHFDLYTRKLSECVRWTRAVQAVVSSKEPVQTPTSLLIRDIQENASDTDLVEKIYKWNPILQHSQKPLYAPLLPFPYGAASYCAGGARGYGSLQDEALKVFNSIQQLESERDPVPLMQGVLQTGLDLEPLRDELYCQLIKQTCGPRRPGDLRGWHLLTCMSVTFLPSSGSVLGYLSFHVQRSRQQFPDTEIEWYAEFIAGSLRKTKGRLCVPSSQEIRLLTKRQQLSCTVYYAGGSFCKLAINSHTTAAEVVGSLLGRLGLQSSRNRYALFQQAGGDQRPVEEETVVAEVLTRFERLSASGAGPGSECRLCLKVLCFLEPDCGPDNEVELHICFEQAHETVVRGLLPAPEETLQALAALRLQSSLRDFSPLAPLPRLQELYALRPRPAPVAPAGVRKGPQLPEALALGLWRAAAGRKRRLGEERCLRAQRREEGACALGAIVERWKRLRGTAPAEAMAAYLGLLRQCGGYGAALFEVQLCPAPAESAAETRCLAVSAKAVSLYKQGDLEPMESFDYRQISSFEATDRKTLKVTLSRRTLVLESCKAGEIAQLMRIYGTHRGRAGCHPTGPQRGDSGAGQPS